ncbi:MAG: AAA family ATPase [Blastocatellia bacterium]
MKTFEKSFSLVSDPRTLYLTSFLNDTIDKVDYTIQNRQGLSCIMGDVGLGKTSILRLLNWRYEDDKENYVTALIPMPNFQSDFAMLKQICIDFRLTIKRSLFEQQKVLESWLIEQYQLGKNVVVFIDESQKLKPKELELVRMFLNFESFDHKLIQVILTGQLELRNKLLQPSNKALYSRIFATSILAPLNLEETCKMISFRCQVSGAENPFSDETMEAIYKLTKGVPRDIVKICIHAYREATKQQKLISPEIVQSVSKQIREESEENHEEKANRGELPDIQPNVKSNSRKSKTTKAKSAKPSFK